MYSEKNKNDARSLNSQGLSLRKISEMTGVPKSTLSDWLQESPEPERAINTETEPEIECPASVNSTFRAIDSPIPDRIRTNFGQNTLSNIVWNDEPDNFRTNSGQSNPKNSQIMKEPEFNSQNRTEFSSEHVSQDWIELKKLELQLQHERELKKMDLEREEKELRRQELNLKQVELDQQRERLSQIGDQFKVGIIKIAQIIQEKGQQSHWEYDEIIDIYEKFEYSRINFMPFIRVYGILQNSNPYLVMFQCFCEQFSDLYLEITEDGTRITFTDDEISLVNQVCSTFYG